MAGSSLKTEGYHPKHLKRLAALFVIIMPIHDLLYGNMRFDTNILKMHMCANILEKKMAG